MTARKQPFDRRRRRLGSDAELANYLGWSLTWLCDHRVELEERGFPRKLPPPIDRNDFDAVDRWIDALHGEPGIPGRACWEMCHVEK